MDIMPDPNEPLTDEDFAYVESILTKYSTDESLINVSDLDGFLTAIVSGPDLILPSEWLPEIWGGEDKSPVFEDFEEASRFSGCVLRLMNESASILAEAPSEFTPVTYLFETEDGEIEYIGYWCLGYLRGIALRPQSIETLEEEEKAQLAIAYIAVCSETVFEDSDISIDEIAEGLQPLVGAVAILYKHWLERRTPLPPTSRGIPVSEFLEQAEGEKIGSNEPCPCGSGRKFKKCCSGGSKYFH